jgi:hypothetical protein
LMPHIPPPYRQSRFAWCKYSTFPRMRSVARSAGSRRYQQGFLVRVCGNIEKFRLSIMWSSGPLLTSVQAFPFLTQIGITWLERRFMVTKGYAGFSCVMILVRRQGRIDRTTGSPLFYGWLYRRKNLHQQPAHHLINETNSSNFPPRVLGNS